MKDKCTFERNEVFHKDSTDLAPCPFGEGYGKAFTLWRDKSGICVCPKFVCSINNRNQVVKRYLQDERHPYKFSSGGKDIITHTDVLEYQKKKWK